MDCIELITFLYKGGPRSRVVKAAVGSSLARVTCETRQFLLAGDQVVFLGDLPSSSHPTIGSAQNG